ncbi:MAG: hypothetical protein JWM19_7722 [Actinomycetia bacterium]|nr:hypothetical protein [Actinomycetes bacterium]
MLWADGYRDIPSIGPLLLAQGVVCITLGLLEYQESLAVPYATLSLQVEFTGEGVALAAAVQLAVSPSAEAKRPAQHRSGDPGQSISRAVPYVGCVHHGNNSGGATAR